MLGGQSPSTWPLSYRFPSSRSRTRAPDTTVTSLLRALQSLPTPSPQGLHTITSRYTTVFDRTLSQTGTWLVTALNGLRERVAAVSTLQRLSNPLEPGLVPDQRLAPVERQDLTSITSLYPAGEDYVQARTVSTETPPTSRAPSPANAASPLDTKGSAALSSTLPSIALTPSGQTTSEVIFDATSGYVYDETEDFRPVRNPIDTCHSTVSPASAVSGRVPQTSVLGISTCAVDTISLPFNRSRKVALKGPKIINHAEWRRKHLDDVAASVVRGGATITLPHLIDAPVSTPSPSSDDGKLPSTTSSWPTPTPSTPSTSIDLQLDYQCGAGTPNSTLDSTFEPTNGAQVLDTEATVQEAHEGKVEEAVAWWRPNIPSKDVQVSRRNRYRQRRSRYSASKSPTYEDWKWAKTEGKKPVGWRRPLVVPKPAPPTTFVAPDATDDECEEEEFGEEELQKSILMSMGMVPKDCEADAEASPDSKHFGCQLIEVPLAPPPPYIPSEPPVYVDQGGFPVGDLEKALQESMSKVQTTVATMGEKHDLDKDGFSKSQQQQAREASREASRKALMTPFYGATTSHALQPLSEEQWALLEEFEATSLN